MSVRYVLRSKYNCLSWDNLDKLTPNLAWVLDSVWYAAPGTAPHYLEKDDRLDVAVQVGSRDLVVKSPGKPARLLSVELQGLAGNPNLWAKAHAADGTDVYVYLLDTGAGSRKIHVDVFYPDSSHNAERPSATTVVIQP